MRIEDFKTGYHYFDYDTKNFDFAALVAKVLGTSEPLDQIHTEVSFSRLEFDNDQKSVLHRRYYESPLYREVVEMYNRFVKAKVLPLFDEKEFAVQKEPNFRVSIPENTAIGKNPYPESIGAKIIETIETRENGSEIVGLHNDSMYGHPPGEINFIVALTDISASKGMQFETKAGSGEFATLEMAYGQFFQFYGNKCLHYNLVNRTASTRMSFDFRVIPMSQYDPSCEVQSVHSKRRFCLGEYFVPVSIK